MIIRDYFKMCEKAAQIQKLFNPKGHNHTYHSGCIWTDIDRDSYKYDKYTKYGHQYICLRDGYLMHCIWLPTQEQLQEILINKYSKPTSYPYGYKQKWMNVLEDFWDFCSTEDEWEGPTWFASYNLEKYRSITEVWLAFVMKEKYNKIWDGKDWKNE